MLMVLNSLTSTKVKLIYKTVKNMNQLIKLWTAHPDITMQYLHSNMVIQTYINTSYPRKTEVWRCIDILFFLVPNNKPKKNHRKCTWNMCVLAIQPLPHQQKLLLFRSGKLHRKKNTTSYIYEEILYPW